MAPWALALVVFAGALGSDAERSMGDVLSDVMEDLGIESEHHGLGRDVKAAADGRSPEDEGGQRGGRCRGSWTTCANEKG